MRVMTMGLLRSVLVYAGLDLDGCLEGVRKDGNRKQGEGGVT